MQMECPACTDDIREFRKLRNEMFSTMRLDTQLKNLHETGGAIIEAGAFPTLATSHQALKRAIDVIN